MGFVVVAREREMVAPGPSLLTKCDKPGQLAI
jgi:hypothetical protein